MSNANNKAMKSLVISLGLVLFFVGASQASDFSGEGNNSKAEVKVLKENQESFMICLLYTSDAADD